MYELRGEDINAAISLWGTWPLEPRSQTAHRFTLADAELFIPALRMWRMVSVRGRV